MTSKKLLRTVLALIVVAAALGSAVDDTSQRFAENALKRALTTFAAARALNGVISVAQGTEVAVEPAGVGVTFTPGQVLDPVNDLVERFSGVMLIAASSLGLQLVLLKITSWWVITVLLTAALLVWLATVWWPAAAARKYGGWLLRLALVLAFVRFAVPLVVITTELVFSTFLQTEQEAATAALEGTSAEIARMNDELEAASGSGDSVTDRNRTAGGSAATSSEVSSMTDIWSRIRNSTSEWSSAVSDWFSSMDVAARMAQLKESAANATGHIIDLIAIFVLQTILFPLAFLWLLVEALKGIARRSISVLGS